MKQTNLIYGKMKSGKTKLLLEETKKLIDNNENILFLDVKEEYYRKYSQILNEKGYNIVVINLKNPLNSHNFNPYHLPYQYYKNTELDKAIDLITLISNRLFLSDNSNADPFWEQTSSALFSGLTLLTFKEAKEEEVNLGSVSLGIDIVGKNELLKKYLDNSSVLDPIYTLSSTTVYSPFDTRGSIVSVSKGKMRSYILKPNLLQLLSCTNFDLNREKTAIFIIPKDNDKEVNNVANIFIDQLVYMIKQNKNKYNFILDNIDFINKLDSLEEITNMCYENIKLYIATRNLDKLNNIYGKETISNILNIIRLEDENCELIIDEVPLSYPDLEQNAKYFNIEKFLKDKFEA